MINVSKIEYLLRPTSFYPTLQPLFRRIALRQWHRTHQPPAPLELKADFIRQHARKHGLRHFVETGTFFGDMLAALRADFDTLTTIELDVALAEKARMRFRNDPGITIIQGDSGQKLPETVARLDQPTLFWLDGHFSGGVTAQADLDTPIMAELASLFAAPPLPHVILIDDARLFGTSPDYPSILTIEALVQQARPGWTVAVEMDIIRIEPRS